MKPVVAHQLGEKVQAASPFYGPESAFKHATTVTGVIGVVTFLITSFVTKPDLSESPVIRMDGYMNLMACADYVPGNYIGGVTWMFTFALYTWSAYAFYARAVLSREEGFCSAGMVRTVQISGSAMVVLCPFAYCWFEVHPSFDDPPSLIGHLQGLVATYVGLAQYLVVQWIFAKGVVPANKHGLKTWTIAIWVHAISTVALCGMMEKNLFTFIQSGEIPPAPPIHEHGFRIRPPSSSMQVLDMIHWGSYFFAVFFSVLDNWDPIAPWNEAMRGGSTRHGRLWAPYVKVSEQEDEQKSAAMGARIAEIYEGAYEHSETTKHGADEDWGATVANLHATFEIDDRIKYLNPDLRVGFLKEPSKFEAKVRVSLTTLASARMAVRVCLPDALGDDKMSMHHIKKACASARTPTVERGLLDAADEQTHKVADFLFQEDLKEFTADNAEHLQDVLRAKHKPKDWGTLRWWWHRYWNSTSVTEASVNVDHQFVRSCPEGRLPSTGIFGKRYYGALPFRLGPGACKWGLEAQQKQDIGEGPEVHHLKTAGKSLGEFQAARNLSAERYMHSTRDYLKGQGDAVFDFVVQVATDKHHDLVKASAIWPEDTSPYVAVGTLTIPGGQGLMTFDDGMVFSPWNNLKEHRPVGALNNARHSVYRRHSTMRSSALKHCPMFGMPKPK